MERKKLKIALTIAAITIAMIGGVMIPAHLHSGRYVDVSAEEKAEALSAVPAKTGANQQQEPIYDQQKTGNSSSGNAIETPGNNTRSSAESQEPHDAHILEEVNSQVTTDTSDLDYDWVEARIQKHRDEIHDDDLEDFRRIMKKLDLGHIGAIVNGEIAGDMDQLLRDYLLSQLDSREYERSKTLFLLYNHLMYEE